MRQPVLVVRDGDLVLGAGAFVLGRDDQDAVCVNLKCDLQDKI